MRALPNGKENGTKEEQAINALKNNNINEGFLNNGKTFSKSKGNEN